MVSLLVKTTRFINDAAGLEKTLRLLQAITHIISASLLSPSHLHFLITNSLLIHVFTTKPNAEPWLKAKSQLALARRYLRVTKFVDAWGFAVRAGSEGGGSLKGWLEVGKWGCLGGYLGLESLTILDAMGVYPTSWAKPVFIEAMKFWFISLSFSVLLSIMQLIDLSNSSSPKGTKPSEKVGEKTKDTARRDDEERIMKRRKIWIKLVADVCDLSIPGSITEWYAWSSLAVGWFSATSTILAGIDVWVKIQSQYA